MQKKPGAHVLIVAAMLPAGQAEPGGADAHVPTRQSASEMARIAVRYVPPGHGVGAPEPAGQ